MKFYDNVQIARDSLSIDQFYRQQTPDTGEEPRTKETRDFHGRTMAALLEKTGPAILITHSNSGQYGWSTAMNASEGALKAIYGNTHAAFSDLNNIEIADLLEQFLHEKGLDGIENSHKGPKR